MSLQEQGQAARQVTNICMGCSGLASMPRVFGYEVSEEQALATLRAFFQSPLNFLDTAAGYGDGESERRIGLMLRELGGLPKGYVLSTKVDPDAKTRDFSGEQTKRSLERSLELLGLDHFQVVFLHDPEVTTFENLTQPGGAIDVLRQYQEQGVIAALGVAGGPIDLMMQYVDLGVFDAVLTHNRYTLLNRAAEPLIRQATERGMIMLNAAPYGGGMLSRGPDAFGKYAYRPANEVTLERARQIQAICGEYDVPLAAAALQFSLRDPRIKSTVVGMTKPERIAQTLAFAEHPIPDELWARVDAVGHDTHDL